MYAMIVIRYRVPMEEVVKATEEHRAYLAGVEDGREH